jgi:hypothetical protein
MKLFIMHPNFADTDTQFLAKDFAESLLDERKVAGCWAKYC